MIAARLTHRARVERSTATGTDAWGGPNAPVMQLVDPEMACFVWSRLSREVIDGSKTALIEDLRIMVGLEADLLEGDELTEVADRAGAVLIPGRLRVEGPVQFKHSHREAALQRIG